MDTEVLQSFKSLLISFSFKSDYVSLKVYFFFKVSVRDPINLGVERHMVSVHYFFQFCFALFLCLKIPKTMA